ncbi:hypothetical protein D8X55_00355 [Malacoplasma penetrans]|uniref:DUF5385 domain-containing protein n=1 Tax=Malacoplasma penetrans TaxID=28227 RepID=UPI001011A644|nr:DUF5385 domain-containing protein [Malacoplasma penetrans]RXY97369.1 hypothetical protein D8X55_00355 [Malacoplasma penetrans]
MNNNFFMLLLIIVIPIGIWWWWKKRKNGPSNNGGAIQKRREGDEVWKTIKDFLKSNNEKGKEIVESYVAKRPDPNVVDRTLPKDLQKKQKLEIKENKKLEQEKKKELKKEGKTYQKEKPKELYVVLFVTRTSKNNTEDKPRAIECEVKNVRVPNGKKNQTEKKIVILGERDYETESKWILPIKTAEENKIKKEYAKQQKFKKLNIIKTVKDKKIKNLEKDPEKLEIYNQKLKEKEDKKLLKQQEKEKREKAKWEKKEIVVKTKK